MGGCSGDNNGVDNDFVGVILNYVCSFVLFVLGSHLWHKHGYKKAKIGILTEYGMSLGYLTGGLVHHFFADRASDKNCASKYFYFIFGLSYSSVI